MTFSGIKQRKHRWLAYAPSRTDNVLYGIGWGLIALGAAALFLHRFRPGLAAKLRWPFPCAFYRVLHIPCLGCGATRALRAFLQAAPGSHTDVLCVFDNEEVGSGTRQGAESAFLLETLRRVVRTVEGDPQALESVLARSFMVSADNAHAAHPNHAEKYDKDNRVRMNGGVVIKSNASQKYATDGLSAALFARVCEGAGVPVQRFSNRSDIAGGSTLGNIANAHASMISVDIGLAQLAMHSANESAGAKDIEYMINALRTFHETEIKVVRDGLIHIQ